MKTPSNIILGAALRSFLIEYLPRQQAMSSHTVHSYRDSLKLLLQFVSPKAGDPSQLKIEDLSVSAITAFLQHLEVKRRNQASSRNVRLSAIHSFFRYLGMQHPEYLSHAQRVLSIPFKRARIRDVEHLDASEIAGILDQIDQSADDGCRDFALISLMFNTGARVSEIVGLQTCDLHLSLPASVLLQGKGRKERVCPLWRQTAHALHKYLERRQVEQDGTASLFLNHRKQPITRFGVRIILQKYLRRAVKSVPSLKRKRIHPHSLRHSTAIHLLRAGVDLSTIAHWLGHSSMNTSFKYLAFDVEAKQLALAKARPILGSKRQQAAWRSDTNLIQWLESL